HSTAALIHKRDEPAYALAVEILGPGTRRRPRRGISKHDGVQLRNSCKLSISYAMKKNLLRTISIYSCCLILLTAPSACNDSYFDTQPDNLVTLDDIFSNRGQTERWLAGLYSLVPDIWNADQFVYVYTNTTDEMDVSNWNNPAINSGALSPSTTPSRWNQYYEKIRLASIFLERIDGNQEIQGLVNGAQLIKQYRGEARFLRAYYYWLIMKDVGPAVIMPLTPGTPEDDFQIPRSSWDECVDFVLSELALAKEDLPLNNY